MSSQPQQQPKVGGAYANYVLVVLMIVYVFNFIDRNILSILAEAVSYTHLTLPPIYSV